MSAKWRALQHRHRYTYNAVAFPPSFIESLNELPSDLRFHSELKKLVSLNSVYAQVNHAKQVGLSFSELAGTSSEGLISKASRLYLEILFLDNSLPLHRTLVSSLAKSQKFQSLIGECFRTLCEEYSCRSGKVEQFCVSRVALSVMGMPKLGYLVDIIEDCAILVAWDVVTGLDLVLSEMKEWARPSPMVMEHCQESLSCLYYLLQRFPSKFKYLSGKDLNFFEMVVTLILGILKSSAFSRDCFVAAGVSFCAALQVCLSPKELGFVIIEGIFHHTICNSDSNRESKFEDAISKFPYKGDLYSEISKLSSLSRLCLIRGVLTAVSRTVLNDHYAVSVDSINCHDGLTNDQNRVKTILYDCILPELSKYCENPTDSHFNFHALTVLQICLQQIKTSILSNLTQMLENNDPITEEMGTRILRIIWNNLEDPLSQTVKQVHLIFDLFLDIQSTLRWANGSERIKAFLQKIASDLLHLGPRVKGRYIPLASLTRRLGAKTMLDMSPDLLSDIAHAYVDDDVCCAVTSYLKCFLEYLRDECWNSDGIERGYALFRGYCLSPFLYGLASGVSKLRSNLNTYALPVLLDVDMDMIFPMLACISVGPSEEENTISYREMGCRKMELRVEQQVAVLVSLLKVSRSLALVEGDIELCKSSMPSHDKTELDMEQGNMYAFICIKGIRVKVLVEWLVLALTHIDESLRVDAAESLFINPKTASLPSQLELTLMKEAVPLNMRSCSTGFQMKWTSMFRKFFSRVRTALEKQFKQAGWKPLAYRDNSEVSLFERSEETVANRAEDLFKFMRWLSCYLFFSCYPSAPYKRKIMAMDLILIIINVWSVVPYQEKESCISSESCLYPYSKGFTLPDSTLLLVGSIVDSWDKLRGDSFRILLHFPTPLPGISSEDMVQKVMIWAKKLVCSPRVRESDAGALTLRLLFRKYVLELGWIVRASDDGVSFLSQSELTNGNIRNGISRHPVLEYLKSLIAWLGVSVEEGEKDLYEACRNSFVHGVLLALRYSFEELDWNSDIVKCRTSEMRDALEKILELVMRVTSLALSVVSADAWHMPEDMDEMVEDDIFFLQEPEEVDVPTSECDVKKSKSLDVGPSDQVIMVGCWLAMKEVSLLLGTITRKIPLPSNKFSGSSEFEPALTDSIDVSTSDAILDLRQLETIGNHFLEVLLKMKHNGAIDKTRAGFTALCNRLLCSNDPRLCKLTESWMEQLMERTVASGQTVDDLLRRSAGIPAAFTALFLSEPEGAPKKLLPRALRWLIDVANRPLLTPIENSTTSELSKDFLTRLSEETEAPPERNAKTASKIRDEGVIPTVHAFNVLRAAFNDTNLATDTSGFSAEALMISIRSFSSPYWEVRNSACQAYTALVRRTIGFLNVQKRESTRRGLSGLEFFHRYPSLHTFLCDELNMASKLLGDGSAAHSQSNLANVVHPSLCPMLILLSRLKPSTVTSDAGDHLDPFLLMPFIRRCSTQSNLRVRVLASRALTGLVSNEKLPVVIIIVASELPYAKHVKETSVSFPLSHTNNGNHHLSFNFIHGLLLQLSSLLDTNCRNLADITKKDKILSDLIQVLARCSWIASPRWCPCPIVNASFLRVLDHMLSIVRTCHINKTFYAIRNLLLELSTECLDAEDSYGLSYYDPTIAEVREQAAISYFSCVFQASIESVDGLHQMPLECSPNSELLGISEVGNLFAGLQERLIRSLSDSSYEVRHATLKGLFKFLKAKEFGSEICNQAVVEIQQWTKIDLQETLVKLLALEKNPRCTNYILRIWFTWNVIQFQKSNDMENVESIYIGRMDFDSVFHIWNKFISTYKLTRHTKIRERLVCCMGICVRRFAEIFTSSVPSDIWRSNIINNIGADKTEKLTASYECITFYVNLIKQHSSSSEPINMRKAAAESVAASHLLEQAAVIGSSMCSTEIPMKSSCPNSEPTEIVDMYVLQILDIWFTCIKLLEDEDDGIRQMLSVDVQKCFTSKKYGCGSHVGVVPTQVEKVIELSVEHLSSNFGHLISYFGYLSEWILNAANYAESGRDLIRRVFDKEIDNHHEEKLLICQICCSHLQNLNISKSWVHSKLDRHSFCGSLRNWRTRFSDQLTTFASDHIGRHGGADWIGGVGNHKDAFLPIYANLLGFYAISHCIFKGEIKDGMSLLSDVVEVGRTITPYLRNPLISNLYLLVVELHENMVGTPIDPIPDWRRGGLDWDSFDPYFLLK